MAQLLLGVLAVAKGFDDYGGVLLTVRVQPKIRAELNEAARYVGCTTSDLLREAIEAWLIEHRALRRCQDEEKSPIRG